MDPNGVFPLIFRIGFDGTGWLKTLVESIRICSVFDSVIRMDLLMAASNDQEPGSSIVWRPSVPRVPGCGFCSRICPVRALLTAWSVQLRWRSISRERDLEESIGRCYLRRHHTRDEERMLC